MVRYFHGPVVPSGQASLWPLWGSGRRRGWLSNLHLGARDPATGRYVMLGKTFKGMTVAMLEWQTRKFREMAIERDAYTVYVRLELLVEVALNDIQASSHYPGDSRCVSRAKRYRPDKSPHEETPSTPFASSIANSWRSSAPDLHS